jgi:hypothetical protein
MQGDCLGVHASGIIIHLCAVWVKAISTHKHHVVKTYKRLQGNAVDVLTPRFEMPSNFKLHVAGDSLLLLVLFKISFL